MTFINNKSKYSGICAAIFLVIFLSGCLHDRDNPNDPGATDNYIDGFPEIRVRQDTNEILDGTEYSIPDTAVGEYTDTTFQIDNTGTAYLDLTLMQITPSDAFSAEKNPVTPVKPGSCTDFTIRFAPPQSGQLYSIMIYIHYIDEENDEQVFTFTIKGNII